MQYNVFFSQSGLLLCFYLSLLSLSLDVILQSFVFRHSVQKYINDTQKYFSTQFHIRLLSKIHVHMRWFQNQYVHQSTHMQPKWSVADNIHTDTTDNMRKKNRKTYSENDSGVCAMYLFNRACKFHAIHARGSHTCELDIVYILYILCCNTWHRP